MEKIMMIVLEESEVTPVELLIPILASLKRETEEFLPIARMLGEKVFEFCASKLKPYLMQALKSLGISFRDYSEVVTSICLEKSGSVEQGDGNVSVGNQVAQENLAHVASDKEVDNAEDRLLKAVDAAGDSRGKGTARIAEVENPPAADNSNMGMMTSLKSAKAGPLMVETPKVKSKRTRTPKVPGVREFHKNLVGCKIMVWWPEDQTYYDGVVESFDPVKKKHKVLYTDGDVEILGLRNEKWMFIEDKSVPARVGFVLGFLFSTLLCIFCPFCMLMGTHLICRSGDKGCPCPVASSEIGGRQKKKAKAITDPNRSAKSKMYKNSRDDDLGAAKTKRKSKAKTPEKSSGKSNASDSGKLKQNGDSTVKPLGLGKALRSGKITSSNSSKGEADEVKSNRKRRRG